ncbi:MAG: sugar nucleotide-binding protein [Candidatus Fermentibacteraceae bacterium]
MTTVLFGATGRLGTALRKTSRGGSLLCQNRSGDAGTEGTDLTNSLPETLVPESADTVINCAAVSSTGGCIADPVRAFLLNSFWPGKLALHCRERSIRMLHMSTDLVWSGGIPPYKKNSPAVPMSFYGWTKLLGDIAVTRHNPGALVVRTSVLVGEVGARQTTFSEDILSGRATRFYADSIRHHTGIMPLAEELHRLAAGSRKGVIIVASPFAMSRLGYAALLIPDPGQALAPRGVPLNLTLLPDIEV